MLSRVGQWIYLNGKFVTAEKAMVSPFDRGFLFGDSLIETMRSYFLCLPFCAEHFSRLSEGMLKMRFRHSLTLESFKDISHSLLTRNKMNSACVRFCVTRGLGADFALSEDRNPTPTVFCFLRAVPDSLSAMQKFGINVASSTDVRSAETVNTIKSSNYLRSIAGRFEARDAGADDVFFFDSRGFLAESSTSNIFVVRNDRLLTPVAGKNFLPGITRAKIIEIARANSIEVREQDISKKDLAGADEIFLTNSVVEIVPVAKYNSQEVGNGKLRIPMTRLLHQKYQELIEKRISSEHRNG